MKSRIKSRIIFYTILFLIVFIGYFLVIKSFEENIIYFVTPKELEKKIYSDKILRVGGYVKQGSVKNLQDLEYEFVITDNVKEVKVTYHGILPNLFRDGQGVIAKGAFQNGIFIAEEILAKHDEKYIPSELKDELKKSGYWRK